MSGSNSIFSFKFSDQDQVSKMLKTKNFDGNKGSQK